MSGHRPLLLINIAGLGFSAIGAQMPNLMALAESGTCSALEPPVPALTSPSQATVVTGVLPSQHGIVGNGWYFRNLALVLNWQRSARLRSGEPMWEAARNLDAGCRTASLFWRHATHSTCDLTVVERPTYWADGRKGQDIYSDPSDMRTELVERLGAFPLFRFAYPYWFDEVQAPDFAKCVAIHIKPGADPMELIRAPGPRGAMHLGRRLIESACGLRVPFDVIGTDATLVRGSHGRVPVDNETRPVIISSWDRTGDGVVRMQDVKGIVLSRLASS